MKYFLNEVLYALINLLSYVVPKKKNKLVFFPTHNTGKFSGNLRSLYLYIASNLKEYDLCWRTTGGKTYEEMLQAGLPVVISNKSFFWHLLRAEHVLLDAGCGWLYGNFSMMQLWHGTGFKNVGILNSQTKGFELMKHKVHYGKYRFILATSEEDAGRKQKSFNNPNTFITGSPRNDIFFAKGGQQEIKKQYGLETFNQLYLYVPTFRDSGAHVPFTEGFWTELNNWLTKTNNVFVAKKHPWDKKLKIPEGFSNIIDLTLQVDDVQGLLSVADVVISDYSGIVTDFVMTDRPVIYYMYDFDEYIEHCRTFYYDIKTVLPGPFLKTEQELLRNMQDMAWFNNAAYQEKYAGFQNRFHKYKDGGASQRVAGYVKQLSKELR